MSLRIALVTPFSWAVPHEANEHVDAAARGLRARGHDVVVLAPSTRSKDLQAGRRALQRGVLEGVVAIAPAVPLSPRNVIGVPVGARANVVRALSVGGFDIVHGFEPAMPGLSYAAVLEARTPTVATFIDPDRLGFPSRRNQRDRFLARVDALLATSERTAAVATDRFPGAFSVVPLGVDLDLLVPGEKRDAIAIETSVAGLGIVRAALRALREREGWEATIVRTVRLAARPSVPLSLRDRVHVRTLQRPVGRAELLREVRALVPAPDGSPRLRLEAAAAGAAIIDPPGVAEQPELVTAALLRLLGDREVLAAEAARSRAITEGTGIDELAEQLERVYSSVTTRQRAPRARDESPRDDRDWIVVDLHMHTRWSHDCSIDPESLLDHAASEGLGAIAVTDHNVFGGALEAVELARGRDLVVIPGEEVKTDGQGEVIGLFLREEIPPGMSFADTVAAIREQDGIVYLPHPFDRRHAIPAPATLHKHLAEIDVLEIYNARLLSEAYNDEALRFARKYGLLEGAGSDAHVLPGVGTGALRMRRFDGPEEFLLSLRSAEVLRRPKSLAYLQSLKWVAQVKEKVLVAGDRDPR